MSGNTGNNRNPWNQNCSVPLMLIFKDISVSIHNITTIQTFKQVAELVVPICLSMLKDTANFCQYVRSPSKLGKQTGLSVRETSRCVNSHAMGGVGSRGKCLKVVPMYELWAGSGWVSPLGGGWPLGSTSMETCQVGSGLVLRFSVFFHRHLSESAQSNGVERRTGVGRREWRTVRRRGDAQGTDWATRLELKVRSKGRNTRNTSASAVWEEEVVLLRVNHGCTWAS